MQKISVKLAQNSYEVYIGSGTLAQTGRLLKESGFQRQVVIITNPAVNNFYGNGLRKSLADEGFRCPTLEVADGEQYKTLDSAGKLYQQLMDCGADRMTPILALGGGVIGDLAGFVAATYMRGVPLVQLPTTLLAQVDSSIGGKTAVNHGKLKNEIGAFYQPKFVVSDICALSTLPPSQLPNGLSEAIKYAVIGDASFFDYLEKNLNLISALDNNVLETIVSRCAQIKADVVANDEKDTGLRNILNFGHTIGHGVESVSYFQIAHGQAVAIGMVAAAKIAVELGLADRKIVDRLESLLQKAALVTGLPQVEIAQIIRAMQYDKKASGGKIRFVLPRSIGEVFVTDAVSLNTVEKVLTEMK